MDARGRGREAQQKLAGRSIRVEVVERAGRGPGITTGFFSWGVLRGVSEIIQKIVVFLAAKGCRNPVKRQVGCVPKDLDLTQELNRARQQTSSL